MVGIEHRTFLYDLCYWQVLSIVEGFRHRNVMTHQLLRLCAYTSHYSMRENKTMVSPQQWLPLPFDDDGNGYAAEEMTEEDQRDLQELMRQFDF